MLKIGITSNIKEYYKGYIDFIDHYWLNYFEKKNINYYLVPNKKKLSKKKIEEINLLIIPGGNDVSNSLNTSKIRNSIETNLIKICFKKKIPILGICRGAQLLNKSFGGKIKKVKKHMRTRHNISFINKEIVKKELLNVNSFHNDGIKKNDLSKVFKMLASDKDENVEMFISKDKKIIGTMWHPEREKNTQLLDNLIKYINKK
jgi:N5-(cytidine 5'-diphosphoramidyl)-L-glutamine hydrolase